MAQIQLEKMSYRFDVISEYHGNNYILDVVQKALETAESAVANGNGTTKYPVYQGHWNVKRHDVNVDID